VRGWPSGLLVLAGLAAAAGAAAAPAPAPELSVAGCHNPAAPVSLAQLKGKVVLLDFWGVWCTPCIAALPELDKLTKALPAADFALVGVHTKAKAAELPAFLAKRPARYPVCVDTGETARRYGVSYFPTYVLIDRAGAIHSVTDDPPSLRTLRALLARH
jgi:thiol-disulfide isomerase/thioredoxin